MTPKMRECLDAIKRLTVDGVPPSYKMLGEALNIPSQNSVHRLVHELKDRGYITLKPGCARSLAVVCENAEAMPFDRMAKSVAMLINNRKHLTTADIRQALIEGSRP